MHAPRQKYNISSPLPTPHSHTCNLLNAINNLGPHTIRIFKNRCIKTIDLSFNVLGGAHSNSECVVALGEVLSKNKTLEHVDLSYNHLNARDTVMLGMALKRNHVLMGLHYEGNAGWVDSRGFLRMAKQNVKTNKLDLGKHCGILDSPKLNCVSKSCWMCSKWAEEVFSV